MAKQPSQPQRRPGQPQPAPTPAAPRKAPPAPAPVRKVAEKSDSFFRSGSSTLLYNRQNYIYMGLGLGLILVGLLLMSGGAMPDPKVWEPERIYSFRRITLAPILMVAGFVVVVIGIFKKSGNETVQENSSAISDVQA